MLANRVVCCSHQSDRRIWAMYLAPVWLPHKGIHHINYGVIQGLPALRETITTHVKKYRIFSRVFDIANQLLTRHSPLAPLGQVDEWTAKLSWFSAQVSLSELSHSWAIELNTRIEIPYLRAPMYSSLCILRQSYHSFLVNDVMEASGCAQRMT